MGKIYLKGIKIYAYHGCLKEENKIGSYYKINLMIKTSLEKPSKSRILCCIAPLPSMASTRKPRGI